MANEVVVDCVTGESVTQPDTFLAIKPPPSPASPATVAAGGPANPNQPLIDAIQSATDLTSLKANLVAVLEPSLGVQAEMTTISVSQVA